MAVSWSILEISLMEACFEGEESVKAVRKSSLANIIP